MKWQVLDESTEKVKENQFLRPETVKGISDG